EELVALLEELVARGPQIAALTRQRVALGDQRRPLVAEDRLTLAEAPLGRLALVFQPAPFGGEGGARLGGLVAAGVEPAADGGEAPGEGALRGRARGVELLHRQGVRRLGL